MTTASPEEKKERGEAQWQERRRVLLDPRRWVTGNQAGEAPPEPSSERFEAVVHSISDGVMTVDREWRITCFNRAAEEITGYRRPEVLGRFCYEVLRSDLCPDACPIQHTVETGQPIAGLVVYISDFNGKKIPVSVSTALYRDKQGRLLGGVETFRDLRQIEALRKEAEKSYTSAGHRQQEPQGQKPPRSLARSG